MEKFELDKGTFCPNCGVKNCLYIDNNSEDYYQGCIVYCISCSHSMQEIMSRGKSELPPELIDFIKEKK